MFLKSFLFKFKGLLVLNVIVIALLVSAEIYFAFILGRLIDLSITKDMVKFRYTIIMLVAFLGINVCLSLTRNILNAHYLRKVILKLKERIFSSIIKRDMSSFGEENTANYISVLTNDVSIIENDYFKSIFTMIYLVFSLVFALFALARINISLILAIIVGIFIASAVPALFSSKLSTSKKTFSDSMALFTAKIKDMFSGFEVVKGFNVVDKAEADYNSSNKYSEDSKYKYNVLSAIVEILSGTTAFLLQAGVMVVGVYLTIRGRMTVGSMMAAVQLMNHIVNPLMQGTQVLTKLNSVKDVTAKVNAVLKDKSYSYGSIEKSAFNNAIEFKNVCFSYNNEKKALDDISITLQKGKKYALVGASGSGKSTILKLLLKYYTDYSGNILVDSTENKTITSKSLYSIITAIHQNVYMFDGSIRDNITLYGRYSNEEITRAIELAGLKPFITGLPKGLETPVGENGSNLSGGEKQRISIARAIIRGASLLAIDEATSSLDNETAYAIEKSIVSLKDTTAVVVTHRLWEDVLSKYDQIFVMRDGRIVEVGNFHELLKAQKYFYSLYFIEQSGKILDETAESTA
jgi:ATP-binding cassette, subfamily B, bacterial